VFEVAICDFKESNSSWANWNMKSDGNLELFRLICSLNRLVGTPKREAKSESSMTFCPRMRKIRETMDSMEMGESDSGINSSKCEKPKSEINQEARFKIT